MEEEAAAALGHAKAACLGPIQFSLRCKALSLENKSDDKPA